MLNVSKKKVSYIPYAGIRDFVQDVIEVGCVINIDYTINYLQHYLEQTCNICNAIASCHEIKTDCQTFLNEGIQLRIYTECN